MNLLSLLLRIVLSVSLIANGAGLAQASTRMQLVHAEHAEHAAAPVAAAAAVVAAAGESQPACHEPGMTEAATPKALPDHHGGHDSQGDVGDQATDCCEGRSCQCVCAQHAPMASVPGGVSGVTASQASVVARANPRHLPPRLPHLIRPPIG